MTDNTYKEEKEENILIEELIRKTDIIDKKLNDIISILNVDVKKNTQKMGEHIDFIEKIYDNVKSPLGFLCNKINYFKGDDKNNYSLEFKSNKEESNDTESNNSPLILD